MDSYFSLLFRLLKSLILLFERIILNGIVYAEPIFLVNPDVESFENNRFNHNFFPTYTFHYAQIFE